MAIELLAPAGNAEKLRTAFAYGADAAYMGLTEFSLRKNAGNFSDQELDEVRALRKSTGKKIYCTMNILFHEDQIQKLRTMRDEIARWPFDDFIVSDIGTVSFLKENFLDHLPAIGSFHPISRSNDTKATLKEMNRLMKDYPLDVAFICIGENGHLAFNDPPADFDARDAYIQVELERRSRRQQVGEGWFSTIDEVPSKAITMSVFEILTARHIICACPDQRKAKAVASCIFDDISPSSPAASIRRRTECTLFLDRQSRCLVFHDLRAD